ncbi:MAG: NAD(P)H-binding protein [Chitinophagaceae bacterium]
MKITITGSLGHISKPLVKELVQKGHSVKVITSSNERQKNIEALGAIAAVGSLKDSDFIATAFKNTDAVYTMVPPANYWDQSLDLLGYYNELGENYFEAIMETGVKRVVNLSSIGGHLNKGNGILLGAHQVENILNKLSADVSITHIRPTEFYYNLLPQVHSAKSNNFITSNIGGEVINSWVSPIDIAAAIAEEITSNFTGRKVRYVASEEINYNDLSKVLGSAIGKPDLKWKILTNDQMESNLVNIGMKQEIAKGMTEMYSAINSGLLYEDYLHNKPTTMGKVKVADFAKEFAAAYKQ